MNLLGNNKGVIGARTVAFVGIMAATLECGKLVLSFLPNVEVVTLLCALYGYIFGWIGVAAALVFVAIEPLIWGFGSWLVTYIIYWPLVAFVFALVNHKPKGRWVNCIVAVLLTLFFGVLTSLVDVGLFMGSFDNFWYRFGIMYARGILFFALHVVSNFALFLLCYTPLCKALTKAKRQFLD